jgi:hypothetical protein
MAWTEEGTRDKIDTKVADRVSLATVSRKPRFAHVVIE